VSNIAIITDSTADIPQECRERYDIQVLPQILIWDGVTYLDGVDIQSSEFYPRLMHSDSIPTSSQVTVGMFKEAYEPHVAAGTPVLAILISSELSGTVESALLAREFFPGGAIEVVDSRSTSMGLGFQVLAAARAVAAGRSFGEVVEIAEQAHNDVGILFVVDTLEYLHKGGRIGGATRLLGTALSMKPVLELLEGRVEPIEKVRTKSKAKARVLELLSERINGAEPFSLAAVHADAEEEAEQLLATMAERCNPLETYVTLVGPVLGTHAGPGTVGLAFYKGPFQSNSH
jgi:DegV family protein with EDD domain